MSGVACRGHFDWCRCVVCGVVALRREPGDVFGVSNDRCCTDRPDPNNARQQRSRRLNCSSDPLPGCSQRLVKSGDVVNNLACNQYPIPGRFADDGDTVEKPGCVGNTDLSLNPSRFEFEEQGVET
jgi:hypothetical protein